MPTAGVMEMVVMWVVVLLLILDHIWGRKMSSVLVLSKGGGAWPRWEEGNFFLKKRSTKLVRGAQTDT